MNLDNAIRVFFLNGRLAAFIPSREGKGHTVFLREDLVGFQTLTNIARNRAEMQAPSLGTIGSPTQEMVEAYQKALAAGHPIRRKPREASEEEIVSLWGEDDDDALMRDIFGDE